MRPVLVQPPVAGSYNSALDTALLPLWPPVTSTWPLGRSVHTIIGKVKRMQTLGFRTKLRRSVRR